MGNSFLQDRGASFAQRRAEEHLRRARVVRNFALVMYCVLVLLCTDKPVPRYICCW